MLSLAVAGTAIQAENAQAIDLRFNNPVNATATSSDYLATDPYGAGLGVGYTRSVIRYSSVATLPGGSTIDAQITATPSGANYTFTEHLTDYSAKAVTTAVPLPPRNDAAFLYQIAGSQTGNGGLSYKIELFNGDGLYSNAYTAPDLRFIVYDVDGESNVGGRTGVVQREAVRIAKDSGLIGYQVGNTSAALIPSTPLTTPATTDGSYLFSGRNINQAETDSSSATLLYFQNVSSVDFQFEAQTPQFSTNLLANAVFSGIDGDLSILGSTPSAINAAIAAQYSALVVVPDTRTAATTVPEPFTIIGTLVGGTAALRMRKKLKAAKAG